MRLKLHAGNNAVAVIYQDLINTITGEAVTDASVTCVIYLAGTTTQVSGQTWPLAMPHRGEGTYAGAVSQSAVINAGTDYDVTVRIVSGDYENEETLRITAEENRVDLTW